VQINNNIFDVNDNGSCQFLCVSVCFRICCELYFELIDDVNAFVELSGALGSDAAAGQ